MNDSPEFNEPNESEYGGWQNQPLPNKSPNFWEQFVRLFTPSTPEEWRRTMLGIVGVMVIICICSLPSLVFNYAFQDSFQFNNFEKPFFKTATESTRTCRAYAAQTTNIYT